MATGNINGVIEKVYSKAGNPHPKYGISYNVGITVNGERYSAFLKQDASALGLEVGKTVSFSAVQSGEYLNFDPKSLKVSSGASVQNTSSAPAAAAKPYAGDKGVKIGHAITNAVNLAIAAGAFTNKAIYDRAIDILLISAKIDARYEAIVATNQEALVEKPVESAKPKAAQKPKAEPAPPKLAPEPDPFDDDEVPF